MNIVTNNHNSQVHIQDIVEYLYFALTKSGASPTYGLGEWTLDAPNIVLEGGNSAFNDKIILAKNKFPSLKIYLIVTEFINDGYLNSANLNMSDGESKNTHYENKNYWIQRTNDFVKLLPYVDGLITMNSILYEQYKLVHSRCFYLPLLQIPELTFKKYKKSDKKYDFVFSGTITEYRKKIIAAINEQGFKTIVVDSSTPEYIRESIYTQSKIVLCPRLHERTVTFSTMRAFYCLNNSLPHIFESVTDKCDMGGFVNFSNSSDYVADAVASLNKISGENYLFHRFSDYSKENYIIFDNFKKWLEEDCYVQV